MKKTILFSVILLTGLIVSGQIANNSQEGYQVFRYPNGTISSEGLFMNGKAEGFWKSYYVTGIKKSEGRYRNFQLDSVWVFFDQSGDTIEKINYLFGKRNGYSYKYKKDASEGLYISSRELFAGDRKEGTAYFYFPDGRIQQTLTYSNGKKEGLSREFDRNGNVITLFEYNNDFLISRERINRSDNKGLKQGVWKEFYPNGTIRSEKNYRDDLLHGYYKEYDNRGILVLTMLYDSGSIVKSEVEDQPDMRLRTNMMKTTGLNTADLSGIQCRLASTGNTVQTVRLKMHLFTTITAFSFLKALLTKPGNSTENGKISILKVLHGPKDSTLTAGGRGCGSFYNSSGKLEQTGSYNNGRPDGLWKWYYENGSLLREEEYFQGQRDGACTEYSQTGVIIAQGVYTDGEKNGQWKYNTGDNTEEGKYIVGLRDGLWKSFYPDGKLASREITCRVILTVR